MRDDYNLMTSLRRPSPPLISGLLSHAHIFSDRLMSVETDYDALPGHNMKTPAAPSDNPYNSLYYTKSIRNCMELSRILTVQALCVFSLRDRVSRNGLKLEKC